MENPIKSLNTFILKVFFFYLFWLLSEYVLSSNFSTYSSIWNSFYHILLQLVLFFSRLELYVLGYDYVSGYNSLAIVGTYGVIIGNNCIGFGLYYAFAALIISYPGPILKKLWFIPTGIFLMILINSFRVIALCTKAINNSGFFQMESHDLFNNIIYILIFLLWFLWIKVINKEPQSA